MISVDTNVLVRFLIDDDPKQTQAARALFATQQIWIAKTVLLETEWVLRSIFEIDASAIYAAFRRLVGYDNVTLEDATAVNRALDLVLHGVELEDAFHLASGPPGTVFVSFDKRFVQSARRAGANVRLA